MSRGWGEVGVEELLYGWMMGDAGEMSSMVGCPQERESPIQSHTQFNFYPLPNSVTTTLRVHLRKSVTKSFSRCNGSVYSSVYSPRSPKSLDHSPSALKSLSSFHSKYQISLLFRDNLSSQRWRMVHPG